MATPCWPAAGPGPARPRALRSRRRRAEPTVRRRHPRQRRIALYLAWALSLAANDPALRRRHPARTHRSGSPASLAISGPATCASWRARYACRLLPRPRSRGGSLFAASDRQAGARGPPAVLFGRILGLGAGPCILVLVAVAGPSFFGAAYEASGPMGSLRAAIDPIFYGPLVEPPDTDG